MNQTIDCLFIGHNEMNFIEYVKRLREMGVDSGAYRDLDKNFIWYNNLPYHASEIFNIISRIHDGSTVTIKPLTMGDTFNLAIAYLGTYLYRRNLTFDYVNTFQDEKDLLKEKLSMGNIKTIAIITTLYVSYFPILEIIEYIKKYNDTAKIIVGGPFIANQVKALPGNDLNFLFKSLGADYYVNSSQGEAALVKIIKALIHNLPMDGIENIYYEAGGEFRANSQSKEDNRLSENMVKWDLFFDRLGEYQHLNIRTSISCPFSCAFCGFPAHAGKYQTIVPREIQKELNMVNKIEQVTCVHFIDDTFNVPRKRFKEILKMLIKSNYKFRWHSHCRCQFIDEEIAALMKESGCEGVFLGIESGSDFILRVMNKAASVAHYYKGVELLKKYGIITYGSFIIGFPGETHETVQETIKFIKESGIDFFRTQLWYCDPITPIWKEKEKYNIKGSSFEWSHATMDSEVASDITDEIFLSIRDPIWVPQYNFEFDGLFHILHRGYSPEQLKDFLKAFNIGVKDKMVSSAQKDVGWEIIDRWQMSLGKKPTPTAPEKKGFYHDASEFDFV